MIIPKKKYALHTVSLPDGRDFQMLIEKHQTCKNCFVVVVEIPMDDVLREGAMNKAIMPTGSKVMTDQVFQKLDTDSHYRLKMCKEIVDSIEEHLSAERN